MSPCITCKDVCYMTNCTCDKYVKWRWGNRLQKDKNNLPRGVRRWKLKIQESL